MASEGLVQKSEFAEVIRTRRCIGSGRDDWQAKPLPLGRTIGGYFGLGLEEH